MPGFKVVHILTLQASLFLASENHSQALFKKKKKGNNTVFAVRLLPTLVIWERQL